jgi:DNA repair exonuclease SbcCD nuclease subunit
MEVLAIGDLHISPRNLRRCELFLQQLKELEIRAEFVVILGDIFDTHETVHTSCITLFNEIMLYLQTLPVHTYVLVGNHDMINNTVFVSDKDHPFTPYKKWDKVTIVDKPIRVRFGPLSFTFAPYVYRGRFSEMLEGVKKWRFSTAIFAHQEFRGAKMGPFSSIEGDVWEENWPLLISGHIHDFDELQDNLIYVGAAMQHTFAEHTNKTISLFRFGEGYEIERISLSIPKKITLNRDVTDATMTGLKDVLESDTSDEMRVVVSGTTTQHLKWKRSKVYEMLKRKKVKVVFRQTDEIGEANEAEQTSDLPVFRDILRGLIDKESKEIQRIYKNLFPDGGKGNCRVSSST